MAGLWKPLKWQSCRSYVIAFSSRRKPRVPFKWKHERRGSLLLLALMYFRQMGWWASLNRTTKPPKYTKLTSPSVHVFLVLCPSLPLTLHNFLVGNYICIFATSLIYFVSIIKSIYICQEWPDHSETCYDVVLVNVQECSLFFKGTTGTNDYANFGI